MINRLLVGLIGLTCLWGCSSAVDTSTPITQSGVSRYEPTQDRVLVLAGQSLRATEDYYDSDVIPKPAGFTDYISYDVGASYKTLAPDYPRVYQGNDALLEATNWGSGEQCVNCNLHKPDYQQAVVAIGMYLAGPEYANGEMCRGTTDCNTFRVADGQYDQQLQVLADWMNGLGERPVFLRIGYEFDGSWNNYQADQYIAAYKYIHRFLTEAGVDNVAYVFQTSGYASYQTLQDFYPQPDSHADNYVDWLGYSYFHIDPNKPGINERDFAREKGVKVFIAEATPHTGDCKNQIDLKTHTDLGKTWIDNFMAHVNAHKDVVRAISYINEAWSDTDYSPQWADEDDQSCGGYFSKSNARLQDNPELEAYWAKLIENPIFLNGSDHLYQQLKQ